MNIRRIQIYCRRADGEVEGAGQNGAIICICKHNSGVGVIKEIIRSGREGLRARCNAIWNRDRNVGDIRDDWWIV